MDTFRKVVAGICAFLFVVSGMAALFAFNIERTAFSPTAYQQAFEDQNLYQRLPEILANALYEKFAEDTNADPILKALSVENWQATIISLLPAEELKTLTDDALNSVFAYLNGNADSAGISLLPFKNNLMGPAGVEVIKQILHAQPACTNEQLIQLGLGLTSGKVGLCNPPEQLMGLITPLIESQLHVLTFAIPDEVTLIAGASNNTANDPHLKLNRVRALMKVTPFFPLFFLFGLSVFAIRNLLDWLKWWGYPFLVTGALSALTAWLGSPIAGLIAQRLIQNQAADLIPPIFLSMLNQTVSAVISQILKPVVIEGLVLAAPGLVMVSVALLLETRSKNKI